MSPVIHLDIERCTGCFACAVACMDQNDLEVDREPTAWRQVFRVESGAYPEARLRYVSMTCMHCEDPPCLTACPTAAITREAATRVVRVDADLCIGCRSCSMACPFGVPRFGREGTMQKCDLCAVRLEHGLAPACVRICPTKALRLGDPNEIALEREKRAAARLAAGL